MNERHLDNYGHDDPRGLPVYVWVLALVVLLLAATVCGLWAIYALRLQRPASGPTPTPIIWTATAAPAVTVPSAPTETPAATPTISPDVAIGRYVRVTGTAEAGVSLRENPDVNSLRLGIGYEGDVFMVVGGPRESGGYTWWQLRAPDDEEQRGWAAANYLVPVEHP